MSIITSLDILLENFWILKDFDTEKYEKIRSNLTEDEIKFIKQKLGYKLIINSYLIKLEKIPGLPREYMGLEDFNTKHEYFFLCMILLFLEDKARNEQFILSNLIEFIQNSVVNMELNDLIVDFNIFKQRQLMVKVLKFVRELGFIKLYDGDENKFAESISNDALYEVTGMSKYFARNFTSNILDCNTYMDIYENEMLGLKQDIGLERRQRVYRRLVMENIVYKEDEDDNDYMYIKNYKNLISKDLEMLFDSEFNVHKNGAYMVLSDEKSYKNVFPSNKSISDIVLLINKMIRKLVNEQDIIPQNDDVINIPVFVFDNIIKKVRDIYGAGFGKLYRDMEQEKYIYEVMMYMKKFDMIRENIESKMIRIMPIVFKIGGTYSEEFLEYIDK